MIKRLFSKNDAASYSTQQLAWWREYRSQAILFFGGLLIVLPFLYVLSISLKTPGQFATRPWDFVPSPITFDNYTLIDYDSMLPFFRNTLIIVVFSLIGTIFSSAIIAYPLARMRFRGREAVFLLVISTLMLPPTTLLIPQYLLFAELGWVNTFWPLIIPAYFGVSAFNVFFLRQHFRSIPRELDESVFVDGGNHWTVFWHIVLPLSKPALAIVAVLHIVGTYNDFFGPLIYLQSQDNYTLAVGILSVSARVPGIPNVPLRMAATILMSIPLIIFYLLVQNYFTKGIQLDVGLRR